MTPKQKKLMDTALALFQKRGFKSVTVEEICRTADVSKMTFYKHFRNKEDLVLQIIKHLYEGALDEGKTILKSSKPHRERIADLLEWKIQMLDQFTPPMLLDMKDFDPALVHFIQEKSSESLSLFENFIKDGQKDGVFRENLNIGFLMHIFQILSNSFFSENFEQYFTSYEDYIREYLDFLFYGLAEREQKT
ncbi:MAG: TetR/AcrR family transcriptional regulator [Fidelibacterota bacterium]